jgi:uncharacterized protein
MSERCSDNSAMEDPHASQTPEPGSPQSGLDSPPPQRSFLHSIFIGRDGLRAGWRLVIYYLIFRALLFLAGIILNAFSPIGAGRLWFMVGAEFASLVAAVVPAILMAQLEGRRLGDYGLPRHQAFGKLFWIGAFWGLVAITALLTAIHEAHAFDFGHLVIHGGRLIKFAAFWGLFFLLVGFFEEFFFRGYTLFTLFAGLRTAPADPAADPARAATADSLAFWATALLLSGYFGYVHLANPGENLTGALAVVLIGLFFCLTLRRTGTLWFAVGFHSAFDWGETYLYSVPDSGMTAPGHLLSSSFHGPAWLTGGSVGPEGSVLVFVMIAVLCVVFDRVYPDVRYPAPELLRVQPETPEK